MAYLAFNSHLDLLVGSVYVRVAEVIAMDISETADDVDITSHDSTDRWRDYLQGLKTAEMSFGGNWLPLNNTQDYNADGLLGLFDDGSLRIWKFHAGTGSQQLTFTFYGFLTKFDCKAMHDGQLDFTAVIRAILVNNTLTFTPVLYVEPWEISYGVGAAEYIENWDISYTVNPVSEYEQRWNIPYNLDYTLEYLENWNLAAPSTLTLEYLETWES